MKQKTGKEEMSIWARTNWDTCIAFPASACCTAREIRALIKRHHLSCFPSYGEINIRSLMARKKAHLYHIVDSMNMGDVFENTKGIGFLVVQAFKSTSDTHQTAFSPDPRNDVMSSMTGHDSIDSDSECIVAGFQRSKDVISQADSEPCPREKCLLDEEPHSQKEAGEVDEYVSLCAKRNVNTNGVPRERPEKPFPISENGPSSHQPSSSKILVAPSLWPASSPNRLEHSQDKELAKDKSKLCDANHKLDKNSRRQLERNKKNCKGQNDSNTRIEHIAVKSHDQYITTPTESENEPMEVDKKTDLVTESGVKISGMSQTCERKKIYETRQQRAELVKTVSETNEGKTEYVRKGQLLMKRTVIPGRDLKETCEADQMTEEDGVRDQLIMGNAVSSVEALNETCEQTGSHLSKDISDINVRKVGDIGRCQFVIKEGVDSGDNLEETHETIKAVKTNMVRDQLDMEKGITSDDDLTVTNDRKTRHKMKHVRTDQVKAISEVSGVMENGTPNDSRETCEMQTALEMERVSAVALGRILEDEMLVITNQLARKRKSRKLPTPEHWSKILANRLVQAKKECSKKYKKEFQSRKYTGTLKATTQQPQTSHASVNCSRCGRQYTKKTSAYYRHVHLCK